MDSYNLFKEQENIIDEFRFRDIHNKEKLMRYLSSNNKYEVVKIDDFDISMRIHIPFEYLKNEYNKNISSYGLILYNKYPLMSPNNRNFSEKVISLRMFDKDFNKIEISNLIIPIDIFIKKPFKGFNNCIFFNQKSNFWGVEGCKSVDFGDTMLCSCTHLTDFSLSKYNPTLILNDIANLITDAWIINDFKTFKKLKFDNSQVIFIYMSISVIYVFGLVFTLRYDRKDSNDNYIYEVNRINYCCSKKETLESINEIKEITDKAEEERKLRALSYIESRVEKLYLNQKILNTFRINMQLKNSESIDNNKNYELAGDGHTNTNQRTRKTFKERFTDKYFKNSFNKNANANAKSEEVEQSENNKPEIEEKTLSFNIISNDRNKSIMVKDIEMQAIVAPGSSMLNKIDEDEEDEDELDCNLNGEKNRENYELKKENQLKHDEEERKSDSTTDSVKKKLFLFNRKNQNEDKEKNEDNCAKKENKGESGQINLISTSTEKPNNLLRNFKNSQKPSKKNLFYNKDNSINNPESTEEGQNIEVSEDPYENYFEPMVEKNDNDTPRSKIEPSSSKSCFSKLLIDGLKIKLQNKLTQDEIIFKMYKQNENEEIKKELLKFFVIKQSDSKKKKKKSNENFKNVLSKKLNEKIDQKIEQNPENVLEKSNDLGKNILSLPGQDVNFENLNSKELKADCICIDTTDNTGNSSLLTKEETKLDYSVLGNMENQKKLENETDEEFLFSKIELRYHLLFKYINLLKFFFLTEYRLISLFVSQFNTFTKTSFLSILIFRLYFSLTVCAILSPTLETEEKSTKVIIIHFSNFKIIQGYIYTNRDFAVALLTIFIVEIPFMAIEGFLSKRKVISNWPSERK